MNSRNPPRAPRTKPKGGRPLKAETPVLGAALTATPYGVDPALVDPLRILAGIAADESVPAPARVAACKVLLRVGGPPRPALAGAGRNAATDTPEDALNRRTLDLMRRRGGAN